MKELIWLLICSFEMYIFSIITEHFLEEQVDKKWIKILSFFITGGIIFISNEHVSNMEIRIFMNVSFLMLLVLILYNWHIKMILAIVLHLLLLIFGEFISSFIFTVIFQLPPQFIMKKGEIVWATAIIAKLITYCMVKFLCRKTLKNKLAYKFGKYLVFIMGIVGINLLGVMYVYSCMIQNKTLQTSQVLMFETLTILFIIGVIFIFNRLSEYAIQESDKKLLEQKQDISQEFLGEIAILTTKLRTLNHDYKNHLNTINGLITANRKADAEDYYEAVVEEYNNIEMEYITENVVVSATLLQKKREANSKGIVIHTEIEKDIKFGLLDIDLSIILGNLLENSIEAVSKLDAEQEKHIKIKIYLQYNQLLIDIMNPYNGIYVKKQKNLISTKLDTEHHGIGTKSVRQIIEKYKGIISFEPRENEFYVFVAIPTKL